MKDTYLTIESQSEGLFKDKGSKFIAFAFPVNNEDEIKQNLENIRKKYYDARHHCYAYRLGLEGNIYRTNDDGEPSNTAGKPIYGQILSHNLTNVLIIVIRYFGGILLGTGGLINAYKTAAAEALSNAKIIEKTEDNSIKIIFDYTITNDVMKIISDEKAKQISSAYNEKCELEISVRRNNYDSFIEKLKLLNSENIKIIVKVLHC
ncbi:MAG: YigZ family protein [Bacteroidetes bacterium GWA2_31_9]|nr:MAG: YigZ family protein [Bacteroidetes bacterium GWA2_31_9]